MEKSGEEYVVDLLPYFSGEKVDHYFLIKPYGDEAETTQLYVRTGDEKCARINFSFKEVKTSKITSKYYNQTLCNHQATINLQNGTMTLNKPLVELKGKKLSCQLSLNYGKINEQLENKMNNYLPQGWSFNYLQYVGKIEDSDDYYYVNGNRQIMKFKKVDSDFYIEESGTGMTLKLASYGCIITDLSQTEYYFNNSYLTKIVSRNTKIEIYYGTYEGKRVIEGIIDSSNRELYFTYEQDKITINSMHCNKIVISIQNNQLVEVYELDNFNVITNDIRYEYINDLL